MLLLLLNDLDFITGTMSEEETLQKHHDESESEDSEDEVVEDIPQVDVDPSTLTALSPQVISKQVRHHGRKHDLDVSEALSCFQATINLGICALRDLGHETHRGIPHAHRYNRSRRSRKIDGRKSHIRRADCSI